MRRPLALGPPWCRRARLAVAQDRLEGLRGLLAAGADIYEQCDGSAFLHRAVDGEIDGHLQTGEPLHVDATCFLLRMQTSRAVVRGSV
ncbi:hypothetical protein [Streptomyces sp. NPDC001652]|uniref:hypothetical protein n=1 Tax=Streptomyces sp. NPDC001652 TaxID=3154393 RepID=UPI0033278C8F